MAENFTRAFGRYLKMLRERRGLSLADVRSLSQTFPEDINKGYLSRCENGHQKLAFPKVIALSRIYEVPADVLVERMELDMELDRIGGPETDGMTYAELTDAGREELNKGYPWNGYGFLRDAVQRAAVDPVGPCYSSTREQIANAVMNTGTAARALQRNRFALHEFRFLEASGSLSISQQPLLFDRISAACQRTGDLKLAVLYSDRAVGAAEGIAGYAHLGFIYMNRGVISQFQDDPQTAEAYFQKAHKVFREEGNVVGRAATLKNLSQCYFDLKRFRAARQSAEAASRLANESQQLRIFVYCQIIIGEIDELDGRPRRALQRWQKAVRLAKELNDKTLRFKLEYVMLRRALKDRDKARARAIQRRMRRQAPSIPPDEEELAGYHKLISENSELFDS